MTTNDRHPAHASPLPSSAAPSAAERLLAQWEAGESPDLVRLIAEYQVTKPAELAELVQFDQRQRWQRGDYRTVEDYMNVLPRLSDDRESALDVIFHEFLLRLDNDRQTDVDYFVARFPDHQRDLRAQIALHFVIEDAEQLEAGQSDPHARGAKKERTAPTQDTALSQNQATDDSPSRTSMSAFPSEWDVTLPQSFGRYLIERRLGHGGMGTVYVARDQQLDRHVALKLPRFTSQDNASRVERFQREARITAQLSHPNICPIHDFGAYNGVPYLTMPIIDGETISDRLQRAGAYSPRDAVSLVQRIALAVATAHDAGVVHRDLKPANLMIDARGEPIVMDFGLARRDVASDPRLTESGSFCGTPLYLAPELIGASSTLETGRQGDIYALGVILYEMLAGVPPFEGDFAHVLRQILVEDPRPLQERCPGVDARLAEICARAIAKHPSARYASLRLFAADLLDWLQRPAATVSGADQQASASAAPASTAEVAHVASTTAAAASLAPSAKRRRVVLPTARIMVAPSLSGTHEGRASVGRPGLFAVPRLMKLTGVATAIVLVGLAVIATWQGWHRMDSQADAWQADSRWFGTFVFRPPMDYVGEVQIDVMERKGNQFRALYSTEGGVYAWEITGTIDAAAVRWQATRAVREAEPRPQMLEATATGTLQGEQLNAVITIPVPGEPAAPAVAEMTLHRRSHNSASQ